MGIFNIYGFFIKYSEILKEDLFTTFRYFHQSFIRNWLRVVFKEVHRTVFE